MFHRTPSCSANVHLTRVRAYADRYRLESIFRVFRTVAGHRRATKSKVGGTGLPYLRADRVIMASKKNRVCPQDHPLDLIFALKVFLGRKKFVQKKNSRHQFW